MEIFVIFAIGVGESVYQVAIDREVICPGSLYQSIKLLVSSAQLNGNQQQTMKLQNKLKTAALSLGLCLFAGPLLAAPGLQDVVIYKMTTSTRYKAFDAPAGEPVSMENRKVSYKQRVYFIYHRPSKTFRYVRYFVDDTPAGRQKMYESSGARTAVAAAFDTNYEGSRNYFVLSLQGTGDGNNYTDLGDTQQTRLETLTGRIRKHRFATDFGFPIVFEVPSVIKGTQYFEQMTEAADEDVRVVGTARSGLRLAKRLTKLSIGAGHGGAQALVEAYLESKGYIEAD